VQVTVGEAVPGSNRGFIEVAASVEANVDAGQIGLVGLAQDGNVLTQSSCGQDNTLLEVNDAIAGEQARFVTSPTSGCGESEPTTFGSGGLSVPGVLLYPVASGTHEYSLKFGARPVGPQFLNATLWVRAAS
jgi:hypothetical protein